MKPKINIGQIFLTHPKDENFTSLYEEAFSKQGEPIELFAVLEIDGLAGGLNKQRKAEYNQLTQILVTAFKRTYVSALTIDQGTFEKALTAVNAALSRLMSKTKVSWYGKLSVGIAAIHQNHLALSTTGAALVYLVRKDELNLLSEDLVEPAARAVKIFSNYSSGRLLDGDRVILSTNKLVNYLALERIREFLDEDTLEETCHETITALQDIKNVGFATFVVEFRSGGTPEAAKKNPLAAVLEKRVATYQTEKQRTGNAANIIGRYAWSFLKLLWEILAGGLGAVYGLVVAFFRRRPKKYLFYAIALVLLILAVNIGYAAWKKVSNKNQTAVTSTLDQIEQKINDANAALIYNDQNKAVQLLSEAKQMLATAKAGKSSQQIQTLRDKLNTVKAKINKEVKIDNPAVLNQFPNIPTRLLRSPNGFLGFNPNSSRLAFYDFRSGETKTVLPDKNTTALTLGAFMTAGAPGYIFLDRDNKLQKLNVTDNTLIPSDPATVIVDSAQARIKSLAAYGDGDLTKLYLLDTHQNQIWKSKFAKTAFAAAEAWLKSPSASFADARDLAVDGNVYVLFADHVDKYFNGQKQTFVLSPVTPSVKNAAKLFTTTAAKYLYLLDPENQRVLLYNKTGKLEKQIVSTKFRDMTDLVAEEQTNKTTLYVLSGQELLKIEL